jgi:hypothetical protein
VVVLGLPAMDPFPELEIGSESSVARDLQSIHRDLVVMRWMAVAVLALEAATFVLVFVRY